MTDKETLPKFEPKKGAKISRIDEAKEKAKKQKVKESHVKDVVAGIKFGHLDGKNKPKNPLKKNALLRADRETNTTAGDANIQVQVNDVDAPSTIAQTLVPQKIYDRANNHPNKANASKHLENVVRSATINSEGDGHTYTIVEK